MERQNIVAACLAVILCLSPLAIYLFRLALVNRRAQPTVISGTWDFVGLVAGLSGFILFGGALVLYLLQSNVRYWMRGNLEAFRGAWGQDKVTWMVLAGGYLLLVTGIIALTLLARRRSLVVYNVDPDAFETVVAEVFEHLGKPVERRGDVWVHNGPLFALDRFERGQTVTLRWLSSDRELFHASERLLREAVRGLITDVSGTSRWLMSAAGGLGFLSVFCIGLFLVFVVFSAGR